MISSTTQSFQVSPFKSWQYDSKEKKFSKVNFGDKGTYQRVKCLGAGVSGCVLLYQSHPAGKEKSCKI